MVPYATTDDARLSTESSYSPARPTTPRRARAADITCLGVSYSVQSTGHESPNRDCHGHHHRMLGGPARTTSIPIGATKRQRSTSADAPPVAAKWSARAERNKGTRIPAPHRLATPAPENVAAQGPPPGRATHPLAKMTTPIAGAGRDLAGVFAGMRRVPPRFCRHGGRPVSRPSQSFDPTQSRDEFDAILRHPPPPPDQDAKTRVRADHTEAQSGGGAQPLPS